MSESDVLNDWNDLNGLNKTVQIVQKVQIAQAVIENLPETAE